MDEPYSKYEDDVLIASYNEFLIRTHREKFCWWVSSAPIDEWLVKRMEFLAYDDEDMMKLFDNMVERLQQKVKADWDVKTYVCDPKAIPEVTSHEILSYEQGYIPPHICRTTNRFGNATNYSVLPREWCDCCACTHNERKIDVREKRKEYNRESIYFSLFKNLSQKNLLQFFNYYVEIIRMYRMGRVVVVPEWMDEAVSKRGTLFYPEVNNKMDMRIMYEHSDNKYFSYLGDYFELPILHMLSRECNNLATYEDGYPIVFIMLKEYDIICSTEFSMAIEAKNSFVKGFNGVVFSDLVYIHTNQLIIKKFKVMGLVHDVRSVFFSDTIIKRLAMDVDHDDHKPVIFDGIEEVRTPELFGFHDSGKIWYQQNDQRMINVVYTLPENYVKDHRNVMSYPTVKNSAVSRNYRSHGISVIDDLEDYSPMITGIMINASADYISSDRFKRILGKWPNDNVYTFYHRSENQFNLSTEAALYAKIKKIKIFKKQDPVETEEFFEYESRWDIQRGDIRHSNYLKELRLGLHYIDGQRHQYTYFPDKKNPDDCFALLTKNNLYRRERNAVNKDSNAFTSMTKKMTYRKKIVGSKLKHKHLCGNYVCTNLFEHRHKIRRGEDQIRIMHANPTSVFCHRCVQIFKAMQCTALDGYREDKKFIALCHYMAMAMYCHTMGCTVVGYTTFSLQWSSSSGIFCRVDVPLYENCERAYNFVELASYGRRARYIKEHPRGFRLVMSLAVDSGEIKECNHRRDCDCVLELEDA